MSRLGGMMRTTRPKKLTSKQPIPIFREDQIELAEEDAQQTLQAIETGVEKAEESEYHLQAAINAAALGNVKSAHIPTPETIQSSLPYDRLYKPTYSQPSTYIRFSSTVEDCAGCPYNLVEEDEVALKILNQKRGTSPRCTETQFEEVMHFFEETAKSKQPYSAVDNPPVVSYAEMEECFNGDLHPKARIFAKDIYEHWKARRTKSGNRPLAPALKFETGRDTDDGDPYVCFRRREVRQVRKTRGRDAQSAEKLRRLRKELEDARQLVAMVRQREMSRKDLLAYEKQIFVQRMEVKEMKRKLSIKDDDEDLINQKPKRRPVELPNLQRPTAPSLRIPARATGQLGDDLMLLEDFQTDRENEILKDIKVNIGKHVKWNDGFIDMTRAPLTPTSHRTHDAEFRPAITQEYLPTPPASASSEQERFGDSSASPTLQQQLSVASHHVPSSDEEESHKVPSFRRRIGRGGRVMIDRRSIPFRRKDTEDVDPIKLDRFKFDHDDDDMDLDPVLDNDPFSAQIMQHRSYLAAKSREQAVAQSQLQAQAQAHLQAQQTGRRLANINSPGLSVMNSTPSNSSNSTTRPPQQPVS